MRSSLLPVLILLLIGMSGSALALNKISGRVVDANTGDPLPFTNVFFASTSIGTTTNAGGWFTLSGFASGKYDFMVSFVGYVIYRDSYTFTGSEQHGLLIRLSPDVQQLETVIITPNDRERKVNYQMFKKLFLGENKLARQCEITNPDDVHVYNDEGVLVAHASKPVIIENKALGYRLHYYLARFSYHRFSGMLDVYGIVQFEELTSKDAEEMNEWKKNREEVYKGSLMHFMRALAGNQLVEELFFTSRVIRVVNRLPTEVLQKKIDSLNTLRAQPANDKIVKKIDSELLRYQNMKSIPASIDSFVNESLRGRELLNTDSLNQVSYTGTLIVRFGEKERDKKATTAGIARIGESQNSGVNFRKKFKIYENGYYDNFDTLFLNGYWASSEKVSTMLPLEYRRKE